MMNGVVPYGLFSRTKQHPEQDIESVKDSSNIDRSPSIRSGRAPGPFVLRVLVDHLDVSAPHRSSPSHSVSW